MKREQLLARRDELARGDQLGELELYRTPTSKGRAILRTVMIGLWLAYVGLILINHAQDLYLVVFIVLGAGFFIDLFLLGGTSVYVYTNGLVCLWPSVGRVVHWGEIRKVWIARVGRPPTLSAKLNDGTTIRFPVFASPGSASAEALEQFIEAKRAFAEKLPDQ